MPSILFLNDADALPPHSMAYARLGALASALQAAGCEVLLAGLPVGYFSKLPCQSMAVELQAVQTLIGRLQPQLVVADRQPFLAMLPVLQRQVNCWLWHHQHHPSVNEEHLQALKAPISGTIAHTQYIGHRFHGDQADVIYDGCDHVPYVLPKQAQETQQIGQRLSVGFYLDEQTFLSNDDGYVWFLDWLSQRGNTLYVDFHVLLDPKISKKSFTSKQKAHSYLKLASFKTMQQRWQWLRQMDVFWVPQVKADGHLWLLEAQALGTVTVALDVLAYPELTPYIMQDITAFETLLMAYSKQPALLLEHAQTAYYYARHFFQWQRAAQKWRQKALQSVHYH